MELEEWELLSDDGFLHQLRPTESVSLNPNSMIDMNYFQKFIDPPPNLAIPIPAEFAFPDDSVAKEVVSPQIPSKAVDGENDAVSSQVFFMKMGENESADIKLDSPESANKGFVPHIDEEKPQKSVDSDEELMFDCKEKLSHNGSNHGGLSIWKMGTAGIGALCSFGFACATICVIAMGSRHREKPQNQKLHFQIYTDEKRINQVVHQAISAVRGAPLSRAHITIGGYFEGL